MKATKVKTQNIALPAMIAALYVAISLVLAPISFGAVQLRFAEMFNHLAAFNKRYIYSLILGCLIVNMFSPLGIIDIVVGTAGTLIGSTATYYLTRKTTKHLWWYMIASLCQIPGVILVASELTIVNHIPFWLTLSSVFVGEMLSMAVGAVVIEMLSKRIDFTNGKRK
ncbi:QueT transporter family protein [Lentilactobacillus senioris]|uniref:QueT transporter family protein n=1 Tax=Lentilactobacillus senioris TaxID=931534 RepID=UPI002280EAE1|nr:QueT transporter family protein [Lentilactobacillus senioris]MCY9806557.1 QueT transporter family protein [Lentilactobacillus senioris]